MPTLPDLNTRHIAAISYWNAIEHGADSLDPTNLLAYGGVDDWTAYSNGIDGSLNRHPALRWRAKTDGWLVVYFDETYGTVQPEDILTTFSPGSLPSLTQTVLSEEIDELRQESDHADQMDFAHADVPIYNYRHPDATHYRAIASKSDQYYAYATEAEYAYAPGQNPPARYVMKASARDGGYINFGGDTVISSSSNSTPTATLYLADRIREPERFYTTRSWVPLAGSADQTTLILD